MRFTVQSLAAAPRLPGSSLGSFGEDFSLNRISVFSSVKWELESYLTGSLVRIPHADASRALSTVLLHSVGQRAVIDATEADMGQCAESTL